MMRIVFMGTPDFAVESLKKLAQSPHQIVAVVTTPDRSKGRGLKLQPSAVKRFALEKKFPLLQPEKLKNADFILELEKTMADVFVVVAFRILPKEVFEIPRIGTLNIHASLLPKYRGAAPINWAIINGEKETGVTSMFINAHVDTGDILFQKKIAISDEMNVGKLHDILAAEGAELLIKTISALEENRIEPIRQNDTLATKAPKITKETTIINFNQPALRVHNFIRGLSPYPAAITFLEGKQIKVFKSIPVSAGDNFFFQVGQISAIGKNYFDVVCVDGYIRIYEVQPEGKKRMTVKDFLNGYELNTGVYLQSL